MPIYEYTCQVCANTFERLRPVSQMDAETPCPDCGSDSRRQMSVFSSFSRAESGETRAIAGAGGGCCGGGGGACACSMSA